MQIILAGWTDDLKKAAGSDWMAKTRDLDLETYGVPWERLWSGSGLL